jgi:hypothetical protein
MDPLPSGKFPNDSTGRALDKVARITKTVEKASAVRDVAKADPEKFGKLKDDMDRTGRVERGGPSSGSSSAAIPGGNPQGVAAAAGPRQCEGGQVWCVKWI